MGRLRKIRYIAEVRCCPSCGTTKSKGEFGPDKTRSDGLQTYCKECQSRRGWRDNIKLREDAFKAYGGARCINCGEDYIHVLVLDHIDSDGNRERAELKEKFGVTPGNGFYRYLKRQKWPIGYQVLCHNCNFLKERRPEQYKEYGLTTQKGEESSVLAQ